MAFILKVTCEGDIRRRRFAAAEDVGFEDVDAFIREAFGLEGRASYVAKYRDDEDDECTLAPATLQDAMVLSAESRVLRLEVTLSSAQPRQTSVAAAGAAPAKPAVASAAPKPAAPQRPAASDWRCGGPRPLLRALRLMRRTGSLRTEYVAALVHQFLPMLLQRCTRKMELIRLKLPGYLPILAPKLQDLAATLRRTAGLESYGERFEKLASEQPPGGADVDAGILVVEFLKALSALDFPAQSLVVVDVANIILLLVSELFGPQAQRTDAPVRFEHAGVTCSGCQMTPIEGPRFQSTTCDDYNLCGACYLKKHELLEESREFRSILFPAGLEAMVDEEGGPGCKGWGKWHGCGKGFGKALGAVLGPAWLAAMGGGIGKGQPGNDVAEEEAEEQQGKGKRKGHWQSADGAEHEDDIWWKGKKSKRVKGKGKAKGMAWKGEGWW